MTVKRGDIVIYEKAQANNRIKLEGETHFLFNEHTLLGIKG
jgi:co-chaperonin GroES (HSP10)